jgi:regulator of RNase E activity RraA
VEKVRPGDAIVADQDGAVVVPFKVVEQVIKIAEEREEVRCASSRAANATTAAPRIAAQGAA